MLPLVALSVVSVALGAIAETLVGGKESAFETTVDERLEAPTSPIAPAPGGEGAPDEKGSSGPESPPEGSAPAREDVTPTREVVELPPPIAGPLITIVERESNRLRPDAEVWLVRRSRASDSDWSGLLAYRPEAERNLGEIADRIVLDGEASAQLEGSAEVGMLIVEAGDRRLRRVERLDSEEWIRLRLARRQPLRLLTRDPDHRRQISIPVALQSVPARGHAPPEILFESSTDSAGEAEIHFGSAILDAHLDAAGLVTESIPIASLAFPCRNPSAVPVDPLRDGSLAVELVTPPRSFLELRVVDRDGLSIPVEVVATGRAAGSSPGPFGIRVEWDVEIPSRGSARLLVEADAPIRISARSVDGRFQSEEIEVESPLTGGIEEVELVLIESDEAEPLSRVEFVATLVRADHGTPIAREAAGCEIGPRTLRSPTLPANSRTDAQGRFHFQLPQGSLRLVTPSGSRDASRLTPELAFFAGIEEPASRGARFVGHLPATLFSRGTPHELPRVFLEEIPLLTAGRVLDAGGTPVPEVNVTIWQLANVPASGANGVSLRSWRTSTDADGEFRVWSHADSRPIGIELDAPGWFADIERSFHGRDVCVTARPGDPDLELTILRKGMVTGRILVDPGILAREVRLVPDADFGRTGAVELTFLAEDRFRLRARPSEGSLLAMTPFDAKPFAAVHRIRIEEDELTTDERLDPIDLRGKLRQFAMRAVSAENGAGIGGARIFVSTHDNRILEAPMRTDPFGRALVTIASAGGSLVVGGNGWCYRRVPLSPPPAIVRLEPAVEVLVTMGRASDGHARNDPRGVPGMELRHRSGDDTMGRIAGEIGNPLRRKLTDRSWAFEVEIEGEYAVLTHPSGEDSPEFDLRREQVIEVAAGAGTIHVDW